MNFVVNGSAVVPVIQTYSTSSYKAYGDADITKNTIAYITPALAKNTTKIAEACRKALSEPMSADKVSTFLCFINDPDSNIQIVPSEAERTCELWGRYAATIKETRPNINITKCDYEAMQRYRSFLRTKEYRERHGITNPNQRECSCTLL